MIFSSFLIVSWISMGKLEKPTPPLQCFYCCVDYFVWKKKMNQMICLKFGWGIFHWVEKFMEILLRWFRNFNIEYNWSVLRSCHWGYKSFDHRYAVQRRHIRVLLRKHFSATLILYKGNSEPHFHFRDGKLVNRFLLKVLSVLSLKGEMAVRNRYNQVYVARKVLKCWL